MYILPTTINHFIKTFLFCKKVYYLRNCYLLVSNNIKLFIFKYFCSFTFNQLTSPTLLLTLHMCIILLSSYMYARTYTQTSMTEM